MFRNGCIIVLASFAFLAGCTVKEDAPSGNPAVTFTAGVPGATKSVGTPAGENSVSSLDILVFRSSDGSYVNSGRTSGTTLQLTLEKGGMDCYAVVNATQDLGSVRTSSELEAMLSQLSANSPSGMEMVGKKSATFDGDASVEIDVNRTMSRVVLKGISVAFASEAHRASSLEVKAIYLVNVNPYQAYSLAPSAAPASDWYNRKGRVSCAADALIAEQYSRTMADGDSDGTQHYFYAAPNPTESDPQGGDGFSARHTRLVIEAELDGETCYYPITLPVMQNNHSYEIEGLTVTGAGSSDPDVPQGRALVEFTVTVRQWEMLTHDMQLN